MIMPYGRSDSFIHSSPVFMSFVFLFYSDVGLQAECGESGHPSLISNEKEKTVSLSPLSTMLAPSYQVNEVYFQFLIC